MKFQNDIQNISILAGDEHFSSSKTYINTLLALFKGFGFDALNAIKLVEQKMTEYNKKGKEMADEVYNLTKNKNCRSIINTK